MSDGQNKSLHPFFTKPHAPPLKDSPSLDPSLLTEDASAGADPSILPSDQVKPPTRGRKSRAKKNNKTSETHSDVESVEIQSTTRRKRRKLSLTEESHVGQHGSEDTAPQPSSPPSSLPPIASHDAEERSDMKSAMQSAPTSTPPKKMLKLSAGGTLVSPPKPSQPAKEEVQVKKRSTRGRPKKEKHLIVVIRYPPDQAVGHRIAGILDGTESFQPPKPTVMAPPPKPKLPKPDPSKPTHPFFAAKTNPSGQGPTASKGVAENNTVHKHSPRRPSAVTPGKLRAQAREDGLRGSEDSSNFPQFGANKDKNILKQPGMVEAPFPPKGCVHVRGEFYYHTDHLSHSMPATVQKSRKMKYTIPLLDPSESTLTRVQNNLDYHQKDIPRPDGFFDPPLSLRVPSRHLVTGPQIQSWVSNEIHIQQSFTHPACESLFEDIPNKLTPFDQGRSEIQAWAQKYSPQSAGQVLQLGSEAKYLRDWMRALTISAVETSGSQGPKPNRGDHERKPKKKRRKKAAELDDFIIDDENYEDTNELVALENSSTNRSLVRSFDLNDPSNRSKITNSILVSGPSGCGKTAMIYAAAKELGFEIFEINPGSRRSGKDVLDKIGDMVENHLVQNRSTDAGNTSADEDAGRLSDAFNKDLESGRQGTMMSFFKSRTTTVSKPKKNENKPKMDVTQVQKVLSSAKPSRGQKQSLILLEEVDIMFEDDKNFWSTIFTLLQTSKRPVVMTCNDEDLVPIQAITYQALLRLSAPPPEIAVDYLLLLAAREGHSLYRDAVSASYHAKRHDLRASIAELQLWCQMGVGDPRGGLSWIFQRWPAGSGVDENNQPIRVVSQNTYQTGMGFLAHETEFSLEGSQDEELLKESWETWDIDPREKLFAAVASDDERYQQPIDDPRARIAALKRFSSFSDSLSDMDTFCRVGLPGKDNTTMDATQPELPKQAQTNYINGMALLQTPDIIDYSTLDLQLAVCSSRLASKSYSMPFETSHAHFVEQIKETQIVNREPKQITRANISSAFDSLASVLTTHTAGPPSLLFSVLDGPLRTVVTDVAPYIRSIAAYDLALEEHRWKLHGSSQGSVGGSVAGSKRARTTRAARSALEGGQRQLTRRERWFDSNFDLDLALSTAGDWPRVEEAFAVARMQSPSADVHMQID